MSVCGIAACTSRTGLFCHASAQGLGIRGGSPGRRHTSVRRSQLTLRLTLEYSNNNVSSVASDTATPATPAGTSCHGTGNSVVTSQPGTHFGWNVGVGVDFKLASGAAMFVEATYSDRGSSLAAAGLPHGSTPSSLLSCTPERALIASRCSGLKPAGRSRRPTPRTNDPLLESTCERCYSPCAS